MSPPDIRHRLTALQTAVEALEAGGGGGGVTLGTANGLSLVGQELSLATATGSSAGAMAAADKTKLDGLGGAAPASGVSGAVQFSDGSALASDATNLFFDNANNRLGVGTNAPGAVLHVKGPASSAGTPLLWFEDSSAGASTGYFKLTDITGTATDFVPSIQAKCYALSDIADRTGLFILAEPGFDTANSAAVVIDGRRNGAAISGADILRIQNNGTHRATLKANGDFLVDTNVLYVDAVNNRVGVGNASPAYKLDVTEARSGDHVLKVRNTDGSGYSTTVFVDSAGTVRGSQGYGNSACPSPWTSTMFFSLGASVPYVIAQNGVAKVTIDSSGNVTLATPAWTQVTVFANSWVTFDTTTFGNGVHYRKLPDGTVEFRGAIKNGTLGVAASGAFTLPVGYRPAYRVTVAAAANGAYGTLNIHANGVVEPANGSNVSFVLTGIRFPTT